MRLTLTIFLLCGLGAAIWAEAADHDAEVAARWPGRLAPSDVQAGVHARLTGLGALTIADIVLGEEAADGAWSFRARALDPARPSGPARLVYGVARSGCDVERHRARCWRLARLELDGAPVEIAGEAR